MKKPTIISLPELDEMRQSLERCRNQPKYWSEALQKDPDNDTIKKMHSYWKDKVIDLQGAIAYNEAHQEQKCMQQIGLLEAVKEKKSKQIYTL